MLTILISLLFAVAGTFALLSLIASVRNGIVRGRAILAELAVLESGRRPATVQRTVRLRRPMNRAVVRRPLSAPQPWLLGVAA
jgi:hypothetical protein